jgi:AraC family transcriptional regulator of adaptative response / DNA-3-methyladenine glycosylase II
MRALRWPDAFPAADVALHKALGLNLASKPHAAKAAQLASKAWQPWRSYAVVRAWASLTLPTAASSSSKILSKI